MSTLPTLNFLTTAGAYTDYRPAIDSAGTLVVFERTPTPVTPSSLTVLNILDLNDPQPQPFLAAGPPSQTRPDWCWQNSTMLFNGWPTNSGAQQVLTVFPSLLQRVAIPIPGTHGNIYPTLNIDGLSFVTENSTGTPSPRNTVYDLAGNVLAANISGTIDGTPLYGGMPAVHPNGLPHIAFAGQPVVDNWSGPGSGSGYNQNFNYIFLHQPNADGIYSTSTMEAGANPAIYTPAYQGRAPAWSPDGQTIAFESDRSGQGNYAIYLFNTVTKNVVQVTDPGLQAQHAKFFPDGSRLILCVEYSPGSTKGIAWVDISGLL